MGHSLIKAVIAILIFLYVVTKLDSMGITLPVIIHWINGMGSWFNPTNGTTP